MEMKLATDLWLKAEDNIENIDPNKICNFGISVLDDALIGILPNDFIIIGGDSGSGKSETGLDIAVHNALNGKNVALFFLEGGSEEAINRIRWKLIQKKYYDNKCTGIDMDYRKWRMGKLKSPLMRELSFQCFNEFKEKIKDRLHIYSFEEGFTIQMLMNSLGYFNKQKEEKYLMEYYVDIDLIIIDHLQYFTLTNPQNELVEMTEILKKVNGITMHHKIPIVMISHLRKKDRDRGIPNQEDFYGTSNAPKMSSVTISMAPHFISDQYDKGIYPTFFRFAKSRTGLRQSYAALCKFNSFKGKYEKDYMIHKLIGDKPENDPMERHKLPKWAYEALLENEKCQKQNTSQPS